MSGSDLPKGKKRPHGCSVSKFIGEFPDLVYNGYTIVCNVCERDLQCYDKRDCRRHIDSAQHNRKKSGVPPKTQFMLDLLLMLIACDIPMHILDKQPFRDFWHKYNTQEKLPSRATLHSYMPTVREDTITNIKSLLKDTYLWLCVDETTDSKKNSIINVIVRVLDPFKPTAALLLASKRLTNSTDEKIMQVVMEALETFELSTSQVLMLLTDGTEKMHSVGRSLQEHGCKLIHVTCKLHVLHLVEKAIRQCFPEVDALLTSTTKLFCKSPERMRVFHKNTFRIPEPPQLDLTERGRWLEAASYYSEYFRQLKTVIFKLNPEDDPAIIESQSKFIEPSVETALKTTNENYKSLHDAIENLQKSELSVAESIQILDDVKQLLHTTGDAEIEPVREEYASMLKKDTGFTRLRQICDETSSDPLNAFKDNFNYACITLIDMERLFLKSKLIFSPQRNSLTEATIETYLMLECFYRISSVDDNDQKASSSS